MFCHPVGSKTVWEIWSKILNQNLIHKTSFKVSTSRVPFPTNRREKLRQRRRTKLQSQLLPAEYFVSHCAIHHLAESPNFKNLFQIRTLLLPAKVLAWICFSEILFKFSEFNFSFSFQISKTMFTTPGRIFCQPNDASPKNPRGQSGAGTEAKMKMRRSSESGADFSCCGIGQLISKFGNDVHCLAFTLYTIQCNYTVTSSK